jgi:hypothetical protein
MAVLVCTGPTLSWQSRKLPDLWILALQMLYGIHRDSRLGLQAGRVILIYALSPGLRAGTLNDEW